MNYYNLVSNQRKFLDGIFKKCNFSKQEDFYSLKVEDLLKNGGSFILSLYDWSIAKMLMAIYPDYHWELRRFTRQKGHWDNLDIQVQVFDHIAASLKLNNPEDWYLIDKDQIIDIEGAKQVLSRYDSLASAVMTIYPKVPWIPWKFLPKSQPPELFKSIENQRKFVEYLAEKYEFKEWTDYYRITNTMIQENGGDKLLMLFKYSTRKLIKSIFPERKWENLLFKDVQEHSTRLKQLLEDSAKKLNIKTLDDWYNVTLLQLMAVAGSIRRFFFILFEDRHLYEIIYFTYGGSFVDALQVVYPEHDWLVWKFEKVPSGWWEKEENVQKALKYLEKELGIMRVEDWSTVSSIKLKKLGFSGLLSKHKGIENLLSKYFGDNIFNAHSTHKTQQLLFATVQNTFPKYEVHSEFVLVDVIHPDSKRPIEYDIYIPDLKLAFEYQGEQHFDAHFRYGSEVPVVNRDQTKKNESQKVGITLISIPHWWDLSKESLEATIYKYRPELFPTKPMGEPISEVVGDLRNK